MVCLMTVHSFLLHILYQYGGFYKKLQQSYKTLNDHTKYQRQFK